MANITISNLKPAGFALFSDSESFMGSIRNVSEDELNITVGGSGYGGSDSGYSDSSGYHDYYYYYKYYYYYNYHY